MPSRCHPHAPKPLTRTDLYPALVESTRSSLYPPQALRRNTLPPSYSLLLHSPALPAALPLPCNRPDQMNAQRRLGLNGIASSDLPLSPSPRLAFECDGWMDGWMDAYVYVHVRTYVCICIRICIYIYMIYIRTYVYICIYVYQ